MSKFDEILLNACMGKSKSAGGLNLPEFRRKLLSLYPGYASEIQSKSRKSLMLYCNKTPEIKKDVITTKEKYFVKGTPLNKKQKKYCRCIAHISGKNEEWCNKHGAWKRGYKKGCTNMYSICTKSVGRTGRFKCAPYYNLEGMPAKEVKALADTKGKSVEEFKSWIKSEQRKKGWENPYY